MRALGKVTLSDLGRATRAEITKDANTLIGGASQPQATKERIATIRKERALATSDYDREKLDERAAKLSGGVALLRARRTLDGLTGSTLDETSGIRLVSRALEEPLRRIVSNGGTSLRSFSTGSMNRPTTPLATTRPHAAMATSSPMLGEIRPCLSRAAEKAVTRSIAGGFDSLSGA